MMGQKFVEWLVMPK